MAKEIKTAPITGKLLPEELRKQLFPDKPMTLRQLKALKNKKP